MTARCLRLAATALGWAAMSGCSTGTTPTYAFGGPADGAVADVATGGNYDVPGYDVGGGICPAGHNSRITGVTYAPNHHDALPGVLVYVTPESQTFAPAVTGVSCQTCTAAPASLASQTSAPDGSFTLVGSRFDTGGTYTVVFVSGGFRHVQRNVVIPRCGTVSLSATESSLPGASSGDDTIPKIAVAGYQTPPSGRTSVDTNDKFTVVLDAIGVTGYDAFDPDRSGHNGGTGADIASVLTNPATLAQYQIVAIPCGSLGNFSVAANLTPAMVANLAHWLGLGGRLYASDLAYSVIDKSFPGGINFAVGTPTRGDPADIGVGLTTGTSINGTVVDPGLASWLQRVGAIPAGTTALPIFDLRDPWGAMDSIPNPELSPGPSGHSSALVWVTGDVTWHQGPAGPHVHPLTAQADYEAPGGGYCGRVVFTSYHVQSTTTSGASLAAQERVLEYLFFQLSSCIQTPG